MSDTYQTIRQQIEETRCLPLPPENVSSLQEEMEIYARFMRHLRHIISGRSDIKILSAIQFTADMMDHSDAHISKVLVDLGLRASRNAFPADFLSYADQSLMRSDWAIGGPSKGLKELQQFWLKHGEDKFDAVKKDYVIRDYHVSA